MFSELDKGSLAHIENLCLSVCLSRIQTLAKLAYVGMETGGELYSFSPVFLSSPILSFCCLSDSLCLPLAASQ